MKKKPFISSCGYSLIELLVAVAILGLVAAPLFTLFNSSFSSIAGAGEKSAAISLCREKMETVKADHFDQVYDFYILKTGSPHIEDNIPGKPLFRRVTEVGIVDPAVESLPPGAEILSVTVTVYWTSGPGERSESLESRLARR